MATTISIRFEDDFLQAMEKVMKKQGYATKTEFIRESVRERLKALEKEEALAKVRKLYGSSKHKTTDEDLHKAREKAFKELEEEFK